MLGERALLLRWYDANARDLPWRRTRDPYAIWVSEVMLQQTRVETVKPYFTRFLERFPDATSLARATEDEVLSAWSGLGYYRRARLLHAGVREVVARYGGHVPEGADERASLPGVGRYTAGAIGSIAFDREEPIVDGNVARVLSRIRGIDAPLGTRASEEVLWREATALVHGPRPGALNQALMELGATVCTKSKPSCDRCPLLARCVAAREGRTELLPVPRARTAPKDVSLVLVVARDASDQIWLARGEQALFGGLWGLPSREGKGVAAARSALSELGLASAKLSACGRLEHVLTHRRLDVRVFSAAGAIAAQARDGVRTFSQASLADVGVSTLTRRALEAAARVARSS